MSTFISYAQNFEDVVLHRVLRDVKCGTYIDVGAQHPIHDSVTRAFYERGWRGVNIEPIQEWYGLLCIDRPEDINLPLLLGAARGEATFYRVEETGLSTLDSEMARQYSAGGAVVTETVIPMSTLDEIIAQEAVKQIHFLKIDVEGAEGAVLRGLNLRKYRPWVIVVESTLPNSQVDVSKEWEHLLLDAGYADVYFDGLNRFYLADEHAVLAERFLVPPNCFDQFVKYADWERGEQARKLALEIEELRSTIGIIEKQADQARALSLELDEAHNTIGILEEKADQARALSLELDEARNTIGILEKKADQARTLSLELDEAHNTIGILEKKADQARTLALELDEARSAIAALGAASKKSQQALALMVRETAALHDESNKLQENLRESERVAHYWWHTAEEMRGELIQIKSSRSWRWTAPLRIRGRKGVDLALSAAKSRGQALLVRAIRFVLLRPALKMPIDKILRLHPDLLMRLKRFAVRSSLALEMGPAAVSVDGLPVSSMKQAHLSPRANRILVKLEKVMQGREA